VIRSGENRSNAPCAGLLALGVASLLMLAGVAPSMAQPNSEQPFEIVPGSFHITASTYQAGAHADWTTAFDFAHSKAGKTFNDVKDTVVNLPAGFMGNANKFAFPTCTDAQLANSFAGLNECPVASQVGTITLDLTAAHALARDTFPVYNMEVASFGVTAELGFNAQGFFTQILPINVRPGDSGITVTSPSIEGVGEAHDISVTIWGLPAAHEHDAERGRACFEGGQEGVVECTGGGQEAKIPITPFLANPTSCGNFTATMTADSWEEPNTPPSTATAEVGPIDACERVPFKPSIEAQPTTDSAESPSGLDVSLLVPQSWEEPYAIATSNLKDARVALPEGYTVNPSAGSGLAGCTPQQYDAETSSSLPGEGCPPEAKLGTITIETPVLAEKLEGFVYLAKPFDNPFDSLLALYMVAKAPDRGVIIKAAGKVEPDPVTGQLVTTFDNNPQQPFSKFTLKLRQGATSPLVSPPTCGKYTVLAELTPWSAPREPRSLSSSFEIEKGVNGGPCPSGGTPPFKPVVIAGATNNAAGSYTPFYLRIDRNDGEQELTRFSTVLPPGLTGNLTGIPFCPDTQIQAAREATGQHELSEPSCPAASKVGHTLVGAGVGSVLAWTPGSVYLAGPYHGAPLSIVSVTSATVGPFDLGTVVIRFALRINPITAQVEVDATGSDPIPHIIQGIVVHVRDIHVYVDRAKFILNPTSCEHLSISNTITGAGADPANPADQSPVTVTMPFQAADCSSLGFKPTFKVTTSGKTSRSNGASLAAKLTIPAALGTQANIRSVKVDLPKQLPSRLTTLQKACTAAQFNTNPAGCPAASVVGHAKAITPLIPVPLEGPAYFVSHGGEAFPSLIVVLQGYGVTIDLVGSTFISKAGITSSTFKTVPDQPVTSFELTLPQGPFSALAANGNLCKSKLAMPTAFVAQNGAVIHQSTPISVSGCKPAITVVRHSGNRKTATIAVSVPSAGKLVATGKGLSRATGNAGGAGTVTVKMTLSSNERAFLAKHKGRRLKVAVKLLFTPKHGGKLSGSVTVLIG
jgi:hypothetical protein